LRAVMCAVSPPTLFQLRDWSTSTGVASALAHAHTTAARALNLSYAHLDGG
jgi:hypothetical protein